MFKTNAELPEYVRNALPAPAQTRFRLATDGVVPIRAAMAKGWVAVREDWHPGPKGGVWVRKDDAGASNIQGALHLSGFGRERKKKKDDLEKATPKPLYVCRSVVNAQDIIDWAKAQGFKTTLPADELHVTVLYSKKAVDWMKMPADWAGGADAEGNITIPPGGPRLVEPLGTGGAVCLLFKSSDLIWRHNSMKDQGASHDFEGYQPHITITWDKGDLDLSTVEPYQGKIVLGPESFQDMNENWKETVTEKVYRDIVEKFAKFDPSQPRDPNGQWSSGGGGGAGKGGISFLASRVISGVAGGVAAQNAGDWFVPSGAHHAEDGTHPARAKEISDGLHESTDTFDRTGYIVAKQVVSALVGIGVELAMATAVGKVTRILLPFLSGPTKSLAVQATRFGLSKLASVAGSGGAKQAYRIFASGVAGALLPGSLKKAAVTYQDMANFELQRLQAVLQSIDPDELDPAQAQAALTAQDPEAAKHLLSDLEDAGLVDYEDVAADHAMDQATVVKVDKRLGLVFGYAIICKTAGQDYYDRNVDRDSGRLVPENIDEQGMLKAATDFMLKHRVAKTMHDGDQTGEVVFAFPLTTEIAKALGIQAKHTGLLIGMKPNPEMLAKYDSGELKGFSIGGSRQKSLEIFE